LKRIIVDASVLLAGMFKDGTVRDLLLNYDGAEFLAPIYIKSEIERHIPEVVRRSGKSKESVRIVLEDIISVIELVPPEVYSSVMDQARSLARRADASGDEDYFALAIALDAPVWTLDRDFVRAREVRVLRTDQIEGST
jgi:predicted nucleic acid-binding protein